MVVRHRLCPCCGRTTKRTYIYYNNLFFLPRGQPIAMNRAPGEAFETLWRHFPNATRIDRGGNYRSRSYELRKFLRENRIPLGVTKGPYGTRTHRLIILKDLK